jgi:hypothetical protein
VQEIFPNVAATVGGTLLEHDGQNMPFCKDKEEYRLERRRFSALKISEGGLQRFQKAVDAVKPHWRDGPAWVGCAEHPTAHDYCKDELPGEE